ncbi:Hydroxymethylpyrimidine/phosphomethylpyrimidine kinase [Oenococcus oeni]|uniref:bifunctional hydroxymethylpyrimidine kinase/phosphomethylpyrimidine kinase n=1 Tax=Oenococcus oeni TaxID=1247 RepID=UPI00107742F6|nr:bifunctional hydroxymethylpyrimidine kinase/phosphomethylpyrimidine kinase [Oenococcus oeni]AVI94526.1 hydroxymethylpyrimidine/phosphomethylpyrimidine kinase [Oenococcus oeni]SYW00647.1 Hydroxymethylpyrimidine/phosphomethylpyrimidine kinase [Oenococcus oeni]SYW02604.1 Hydroxymethylpyrimidine/phosphomethylpyrimidine kinase [Oenococcus oeni]SYW19042.1 Hydroxymethylpyrimidine/phosphomethylpyrimidine kinase [Oenococcus oeni]VDC15113.1 Hydroxymethylpyrimidine/phosphomethylpyrimidine kinase [Oeno
MEAISINSFPQAVTIAGSDSDGSAGAQADLHAFFSRHVYGMSILVAAVAGNSYGISAGHNFPLDFIDAEFKALADDFHIKSAKTGMLADSELILDIVKNYQKVQFGPLVVDPVITTKHGAKLLEDEAIDTLRERLLPLAEVVTPNFSEAQVITGSELKDQNELVEAAEKIQKFGAKNVVIKGTHLIGSKQKKVSDYVLLENGDGYFLSEEYIDTSHINGTGDTFSAVIAAEIAKGETVKNSIEIAKKATHQAIVKTIGVGHKFGPINHWAIE